MGDLLDKLKDLESSSVVLAANCREERGVSFSIAAAQLKTKERERGGGGQQ